MQHWDDKERIQQLETRTAEDVSYQEVLATINSKLDAFEALLAGEDLSEDEREKTLKEQEEEKKKQSIQSSTHSQRMLKRDAEDVRYEMKREARLITQSRPLDVGKAASCVVSQLKLVTQLNLTNVLLAVSGLLPFGERENETNEEFQLEIGSALECVRLSFLDNDHLSAINKMMWVMEGGVPSKNFRTLTKPISSAAFLASLVQEENKDDKEEEKEGGEKGEGPPLFPLDPQRCLVYLKKKSYRVPVAVQASCSQSPPSLDSNFSLTALQRQMNERGVKCDLARATNLSSQIVGSSSLFSQPSFVSMCPTLTKTDSPLLSPSEKAEFSSALAAGGATFPEGFDRSPPTIPTYKLPETMSARSAILFLFLTLDRLVSEHKNSGDIPSMCDANIRKKLILDDNPLIVPLLIATLNYSLKALGAPLVKPEFSGSEEGWEGGRLFGTSSFLYHLYIAGVCFRLLGINLSSFVRNNKSGQGEACGRSETVVTLGKTLNWIIASLAEKVKEMKRKEKEAKQKEEARKKEEERRKEEERKKEEEKKKEEEEKNEEEKKNEEEGRQEESKIEDKSLEKKVGEESKKEEKKEEKKDEGKKGKKEEKKEPLQKDDLTVAQIFSEDPHCFHKQRLPTSSLPPSPLPLRSDTLYTLSGTQTCSDPGTTFQKKQLILQTFFTGKCLGSSSFICQECKLEVEGTWNSSGEVSFVSPTKDGSGFKFVGVVKEKAAYEEEKEKLKRLATPVVPAGPGSKRNKRRRRKKNRQKEVEGFVLPSGPFIFGASSNDGEKPLVRETFILVGDWWDTKYDSLESAKGGGATHHGEWVFEFEKLREVSMSGIALSGYDRARPLSFVPGIDPLSSSGEVEAKELDVGKEVGRVIESMMKSAEMMWDGNFSSFYPTPSLQFRLLSVLLESVEQKRPKWQRHMLKKVFFLFLFSFSFSFFLPFLCFVSQFPHSSSASTKPKKQSPYFRFLMIASTNKSPLSNNFSLSPESPTPTQKNNFNFWKNLGFPSFFIYGKLPLFLFPLHQRDLMLKGRLFERWLTWLLIQVGGMREKRICFVFLLC